MGIEGTRARSHAHAKRYGRYTVHVLVVAIAVVAVAFASQYPGSSRASSTDAVPAFTLSGATGSAQWTSSALLRASGSIETRESVSSLTIRSDVASVRAAGAVSPAATFSASVSAATANSGEAGAGVKPLADIVDPRQPFVLYVTQPGDTVSGVAARFGIQMGTLLDNNPTIDDRNLLQLGQQLVVPRKDGILYKAGYGETVDSIVNQFDNITVSTVLDYKPNALSESADLEAGRFVLLPGATRKPPPPPPPRPTTSGGGGGTGGAPMPGGSGRFGIPLAAWHGVSDPFGGSRGGGRIHEGIDLDLYGFHHSTIFSACTGTVSKVEYLTYSYGYHVVVDCGDGWTTLYAHMDDISVAPGQRVSKGTPLGISGLTGYTTGEHLHFEIRYNGAPVNPADYLF